MTSFNTNGNPSLYLKLRFFTSIDVSVLGQSLFNVFFISGLVSNSPSGGRLLYSNNLSTLTSSPLNYDNINNMLDVLKHIDKL